MPYKIIDLQIMGREFGDGAIFKTKKDVLEQLVDYHNIDFSGVDEEDNYLTIEEYFKFWKIDTEEYQLNWILEYGDWEILKI